VYIELITIILDDMFQELVWCYRLVSKCNTNGLQPGLRQHQIGIEAADDL